MSLLYRVQTYAYWGAVSAPEFGARHMAPEEFHMELASVLYKDIRT